MVLRAEGLSRVALHPASRRRRNLRRYDTIGNRVICGLSPQCVCALAGARAWTIPSTKSPQQVSVPMRSCMSYEEAKRDHSTHETHSLYPAKRSHSGVRVKKIIKI